MATLLALKTGRQPAAPWPGWSGPPSPETPPAEVAAVLLDRLFQVGVSSMMAAEPIQLRLTPEEAQIVAYGLISKTSAAQAPALLARIDELLNDSGKTAGSKDILVPLDPEEAEIMDATLRAIIADPPL